DRRRSLKTEWVEAPVELPLRERVCDLSSALSPRVRIRSGRARRGVRRQGRRLRRTPRHAERESVARVHSDLVGRWGPAELLAPGEGRASVLDLEHGVIHVLDAARHELDAESCTTLGLGRLCEDAIALGLDLLDATLALFEVGLHALGLRELRALRFLLRL